MPALAKFMAMPPPMVPAPISAADLDLARRRVLGHIGDLADLALGEEQMAQRLRLVGWRAASRTARARAARPWRTAASPPLRRSRRWSAAPDSRDTPWRCARALLRKTPRRADRAWHCRALVLRISRPSRTTLLAKLEAGRTISPLTISSIRPSSSAFSAPIGSPRRRSSAAPRSTPITRGSRCVPAGARQNAELHFRQAELRARRARTRK